VLTSSSDWQTPATSGSAAFAKKIVDLSCEQDEFRFYVKRQPLKGIEIIRDYMTSTIDLPELSRCRVERGIKTE